MDDRRPTPQPTRAVRLLVLLVVACALLATACTDLDGERITPLLGERVTVTVTASAGEDRIVRHDLRLDDGMTALDALMMVADAQVTPNGTVQLVNGRGGGVIRDLGPEPAGWFYRINGMEADMPANLYKLRPGDSLWWDLRRWDAYPVIPVAVGGFPQMVFAGYRDVIRPTRIAYEPEFVKVSEEFEKLLEQVSPERRKLQHESLLGGSDTDKGELVATVAVEPQRTNIAIGTWEELRLDPFISEIAFNPRPNGLTVWVEGGMIRRQHPDSEYSEPLVEADGFVWAATTDGQPDGSIVLVVSGLTEEGVRNAAAALLDGRMLGYLAAAVDKDGNVIP